MIIKIKKPKTWTRKEVSKITGITDRRILFYSEQNILPGFKKAVGRGTARAYSVQDIFYLLLLKELNALGLSLTSIREIIMFLWKSSVGLLQIKKKGVQVWKNGAFTKKPVYLVISMHPKLQISSPDSKSCNEELEMQLAAGSEDIPLHADRSSTIVINLNKVFEKAGL
jgi:hypothetical protein